MIGTCESFGGPFLLEKGSGSYVGKYFSGDVKEVVFVPRLPNFLEGPQ